MIRGQTNHELVMIGDKRTINWWMLWKKSRFWQYTYIYTHSSTRRIVHQWKTSFHFQWSPCRHCQFQGMSLCGKMVSCPGSLVDPKFFSGISIPQMLSPIVAPCGSPKWIVNRSNTKARFRLGVSIFFWGRDHWTTGFDSIHITITWLNPVEFLWWTLSVDHFPWFYWFKMVILLIISHKKSRWNHHQIPLDTCKST